MKKNVYAILGAGRQGQAIVYDLIRFGEAKEIYLFDQDSQRLQFVREKIKRLLNEDLMCPIQLPFPEGNEVILRILSGRNINIISSLPYRFNKEAAELALEAKANFCDLGGNTDIVWRELNLNEKAKKAGISIIPDCGLMPGAGNILAAYALDNFDECDEIKIYVGGLPQEKNVPLGYKLTFSIEGLLNEYQGKSNILRDGRIVQVDALSELETIFFPNITTSFEAFVTSGGTSTAAWSFQEKVKNYIEKTVRYPGHLHNLLTLKSLGLFEKEAIKVSGLPVIPQQFFKILLEKKLGFHDEEERKDFVVFFLKAVGKKNGCKKNLEIFWLDYCDEKTGFTAMERTTGFSTAIVSIMQAEKKVPLGALPPEIAVNSRKFLNELIKRDFEIKFS